MDQSGVTVDASTLQIAQTLPDATTSAAGKMSAADKTKLNTIEEGATANTTEGIQDTAAALLTGGTHTGISFAYNDAANRIDATVTLEGLAAYIHSQPTPAITWTINHNLGRYPSVELFNSGMQEIDAEIAHPSINQTVVTLNPATAGLARLI